MRGAVVVVAALPMAMPAMAEDEPLQKFAPCMDGAIAAFERELARKPSSPQPGRFDIGDTGLVDVCSVSGIMICDLLDDPLPCQHRLAAEQEAWRGAVLDSLPEPEKVAGIAGEWSDDLYPQLYALAQDQSAGADCAGASDTMEAWCEAREAGRRAQSAVLAWQLARFLDAAPDAVTAGWAMVPAPKRPRWRED